MIKLVVHTCWFALLLMSVAGAVRAEIVSDLYSAEVPVADQSSAELGKASRAALSEVLVKVSGSTEVLRNPVIAPALANARAQVQRYSYSENPLAPQGLIVRLLFDRTYVSELLIEAGAPIWTENRPAVLVWLVINTGEGRRFVNADTAPALVATMREEFARRGVPLQLPLFDLADASALNPDEAWGLDNPALLPASARYKLQDVLVGRLSLLTSGSVAGDWSYSHEDSQILRSATVDNEELFIREGVTLVAEAMAARYGVAATLKDGGLSLSVSGVTGYADYAAVVSWLESLEPIEYANVEWVRGDTIALRLRAQADASQLAAIIELNQRLVPLPISASGTELSYQWQK